MPPGDSEPPTAEDHLSETDRAASLPEPTPSEAYVDEAVARINEPTRELQRDTFSLGTRARRPSTPAVRPSSSPPVSSRGVFRVTGVPPAEDDERTPEQILEDCHRDYLDHGPGGAREAKRMIRRLRSIDETIDGEQRDLFTFLLVEALDAAQGTGAANHALQEHWETLGGTPLVTLAVADRLVRRGDLKPALQLYRRVLARDLRDVRSRGQVALDAASAAWRLGDDETMYHFLDVAAAEPDTAELAERRRKELPSAPLPPKHLPPSNELFNFHWDAAKSLREPSRIKTDAPPPSASDLPTEGDSSIPPDRTTDPGLQPPEEPSEPTEDDVGEEPEAPAEEAPSGDMVEEPQRLSLDVETLDPSDDDIVVSTETPPLAAAPSSRPRSSRPSPSSRPPSVADRHSYPPGHQTVEHVTSIPPAPSEPPQLVSVVRRIPTFPELTAPNEEQLFDDLLDGDVEAGDQLVALFGQKRTHDVLSVRRYQATLERGDVGALRRLRDAAIADQAGAFARAVDHVIGVFDPAEPPRPAAPLNQLPAQPANTKKLLFSWLDGTVNEALALVCDSGMMRRELADYDLTGADRVPPVATTAVGRVYAAMTRLLDLGVRLFHRQRKSGPLRTRVALVTPLGAILEGQASEDSPELAYVVASALAAATPSVALVEALEEKQVRNIVAALRAGFGPVEENSVTASSPEQMRIAEDLWHMVPAAADRRLRTICRDTHVITYEIAVANGDSTRRRAGLFGCGDLLVSFQQTQRELDLPSVELTGDALRELCQHPAIADLYDLAILPEYAEARWTA
jgi:hypothetical protein